MRYIADTTEFQIEEPTIVTLGKFDGRHRGHQKLLRTMMELKVSPRPLSPPIWSAAPTWRRWESIIW